MKANLTLKSLETHLASLSVAIVCGLIGAILTIWTVFSYKYFYDIDMTILFSVLMAAVFGFCISWLVCQHLFTSAHVWYGAKSLYHRIYDGVAVVSGVMFYHFLI